MNYVLLRLFLFVTPFFYSLGAYSSWNTVAPGIEYQDIGYNILTPWQHIHAFRIDLKQNQLKVLTAKSLGTKSATAETFAKKGHALITINGGFFGPDYQPLGLRVSNQKKITPLKPISWWGIFSISNQGAQIRSYQNFESSSMPMFAIQSGPRLIINGKIPRLKDGLAQRTALGITHHNKVILLITENNAMTTTDLAKRMKQPPLSCQDALNLDGGSSTQLYTHLPELKLNILGFSAVSDAVLVLRK